MIVKGGVGSGITGHRTLREATSKLSPKQKIEVLSRLRSEKEKRDEESIDKDINDNLEPSSRSVKDKKLIEDIKNKMITDFNIERIKVFAGGDINGVKSNPVHIMNSIIDRYSYIKENYPNIFNSQMKSFVLSEIIGQDSYFGVQLGMYGRNKYNPATKESKVEIAARTTWVSESKAIIHDNDPIDSKEIARTAVHELGHHYYFTGLKDIDKNKFESVYNKLSQNAKYGISLYGATSHREGFAEAFTIIADKNYVKGTLPATVEKFMNNMLDNNRKK